MARKNVNVVSFPRSRAMILKRNLTVSMLASYHTKFRSVLVINLSLRAPCAMSMLVITGFVS